MIIIRILRTPLQKPPFSTLFSTAAVSVLALTLTLLATSGFAQEGQADGASTPAKNALPAGQRIVPLEVTITGGVLGPVRRLPGSSTVISKKTLDQGNFTDPTRAVRSAPGVNVQEEDGFGLRPNIGMRGGRIDRSADITLMEDGVLIAPAPYAAPAAYYFPRIERMDGIEVRKGASAIQYGPRTTNGALNFISTPVPDILSGEALIAGGSYDSLRSGASLGNSWGNWGAVVDHYTTTSDGFKKIDLAGGDTGFVAQDTIGKLRYRTDAAAPFYQEVELKLGYTTENSDETYLGLTNADFLGDPYRRYASSQNDNMEWHHETYQLSHYIEPLRGLGVRTTLYRHNFDRNWYRIASVTAGSNASITSVVNDPASFPAHLAILRGEVDSADNAITLRANKRQYISQGVQTAVSYAKPLWGVTNRFEAGLRWHYDEEDRFQHEDGYRITGGTLTRTRVGAPGSNANRIGSATALAGYLLDRIELGKLAVTPGARYEYVDLKTENYGTADPDRTGIAKQEFDSTITAFVPGLGIDYALTEEWTLLAGLHKGFSPPEPPSSATAADNAKEEKSLNYEAGVRYGSADLQADVIGFLTDYENLLGRDTFSSGGASAGDQFNGGEVRVYGLEVGTTYNLGAAWEDAENASTYRKYRFPLILAYTYTNTAFQNTFASSFAEWGNVEAGDELPYIPEHQLYLSLGVEARDWLVNVGARWTDRMRTVAGSGDFSDAESTDASFVVDANAEYELLHNLRGFVSANNLFDEEYVAARRPSGARPGAPQIVFAGIKMKF